ncbi:MAG: AAA family ATPase [Verrucomicrobiales bacterium]|nr:AAA family ATPase [Verrucomicrobiales bacterium]
MPEVQQVKRLILSQFQQFRLCDLNFSDPATGHAPRRICLTGPNGSGKSTILAQLYHAVSPDILPIAVDEEREVNALILTEYELGTQSVFLARNGLALGSPGSVHRWFSSDIENAPGWEAFLDSGMGFREFNDQFDDYHVNDDESLSAPETAAAWMSPAMDLIDSMPADDLRELVNGITDERTADFNTFLKQPENREKTIAAVEEEFEAGLPDLLGEIALAWKPVLAPANIRFPATAPAGLLSGRTGESIPFSSLSPGLQRYLLRSGHLLNQQRKQPGMKKFRAIDEPENGLSIPLAKRFLTDCLFDFGETGSQLFVATLSSEIARLFESYEIFTLAFDEEKGVSINSTSKAEAPTEPIKLPVNGTRATSARPNQTKLSRLKREIQETEDQDELADLIDELMSIRKG